MKKAPLLLLQVAFVVAEISADKTSCLRRLYQGFEGVSRGLAACPLDQKEGLGYNKIASGNLFSFTSLRL
jgi:hypothetical protein